MKTKYIIVKLLKLSDKENILKVARGKKNILHIEEKKDEDNNVDFSPE